MEAMYSRIRIDTARAAEVYCKTPVSLFVIISTYGKFGNMHIWWVGSGGDEWRGGGSGEVGVWGGGRGEGSVWVSEARQMRDDVVVS